MLSCMCHRTHARIICTKKKVLLFSRSVHEPAVLLVDEAKEFLDFFSTSAVSAQNCLESSVRPGSVT